MEIETNKTYNFFDDGKIRESRRSLVIITKIIPFNEIDSETLELWKEEVEECDWLYSKETDYFLIGEFTDKEQLIFVRTLNDGWFSIGFNHCGRLDVDGSLTEELNNIK